jgi:hypothetical protein
MIDRTRTLIIGIDPGTQTGVAVWDRKDQKFRAIHTLSIHRALQFVTSLNATHPGEVFVRFEDARKRKFFRGENMDKKQQGAGSIKRDCSIWEDFLTDNHIPFDNPAAAKMKTKYKADMFQKLTGWKHITSSHARDAAMLVFKL